MFCELEAKGHHSEVFNSSSNAKSIKFKKRLPPPAGDPIPLILRGSMPKYDVEARNEDPC